MAVNRILLITLYLIYFCVCAVSNCNVYEKHVDDGYIASQNITVVKSVQSLINCLILCNKDSACHSVSYNKKLNGSCLFFNEYYSEHQHVIKHVDWESAGLSSNTIL